MSAQIQFISAGAGSGKTFRLTQILSEALSSGKAMPGGVIATTFTKKAASELRERVRSHLLKEGKFSLANAMGQARIGTVNSVCGSFLERFAFEAGLSTELQVIDDAQSKVFIHRAIDAALTESLRRELTGLATRLDLEDWPDLIKNLIDLCRSNAISADELLGMATANADAFLALFPKPATDDLDALVVKEIDRVVQMIKPAIEAGTVKTSKDYLRELETIRRNLGKSYGKWKDWIFLHSGNPGAKYRQDVEPIADIAKRFESHPRLHQDVRDLIDRVFSAASHALGHYAALKQEMGVLDFADQETLLLKLLDEPAVSKALAEELDLLLVDEFQDTSPIQLALFLKLAKLAKQTYWVGDIKQAIYGFRGSDTRLMQAVLAALPSLGGSKDVLGASWRSRPPLVELINDVFVQAFGNSLPAEEVKLEPKRDDPLAKTKSSAAFAHWRLVGKNIGLRSASLALGVKQLVQGGRLVVDRDTKLTRKAKYSDIALLSKSNDGVDAVVAALKKSGIPVSTSQAGLLATPEVVLALACLRRLNDSADTIATAEILSLADCLSPEVWVSDRLEYLGQGGIQTAWKEQGDSAHPLLLEIAEVRTALPLLAPREALDTVITRCKLHQHVLQWRADDSVARQRFANLEALLDLAQQYEDQCRNAQRAATISGLILWLDEQAQAEEDGLALPALDAVRVMTHHAAKGLEWPIVILLGLESEVRNRLWQATAIARSEIDAQNPLKDRFIHFWPWPFGKKTKDIELLDSALASNLGKMLTLEANEEAKRLLYVSMTRARDLLIFAVQAKDKESPWLDVLGADVLAPIDDEDPEEISLNSDARIPYQCSVLDAEAEQDASASIQPSVPLYWFESLPELEQGRLSLNFSASSAEPVPCQMLEKIQIGQRMVVNGRPEMSVLGTAIHACIGASFTDKNAPLVADEYEAILQGFGVEGCVSVAKLEHQTLALHQWINTRWPGAKAIAEIPIEARFPNGQLLNGRIDLLLETDQGLILIDHKSSLTASDQWDKQAVKYSGQIKAYKEALEAVSSKPVTECWLYFPVAAGAIRLEV